MSSSRERYVDQKAFQNNNLPKDPKQKFEKSRKAIKVPTLTQTNPYSNPYSTTPYIPEEKKNMSTINAQASVPHTADLLIVSRELAGFTKPPERGYFSVKNYFDSQDPICNPESYIYRKEDIVTLKAGWGNAWLDAFIEKIIHTFSSPTVRFLFCPQDLLDKADPVKTSIHLYSRDRINKVVGVVIMITILALLIVPVYVLWHLAQSVRTSSLTAVMITILLLATLLFSLALSKFTSAKRHETLAAAATYCAVLVVFLGNVGQSSSGSGNQ